MEHHFLPVRNGQSLQSILREIIFGLEDGMVSTLGAVTGIAIGSGNHYITILSGMVLIFVESLSMAAGTYLSSKSERAIAERYLAEEREEIRRFPKKEKEELRAFYKPYGFTEKELDVIEKKMSVNGDLLLEEMARRELKIFPDRLEKPKANALYMGFSYLLGGAIPLVSYFFLPISSAILFSIPLTTLGLFVLGVLTARFTVVPWWKSGLEMVTVAMSAAIVGYLVAKVVQLFFGVSI